MFCSEMSPKENSNSPKLKFLPGLIMLPHLVGNRQEVSKWNSKVWEQMETKCKYLLRDLGGPKNGGVQILLMLNLPKHF